MTLNDIIVTEQEDFVKEEKNRSKARIRHQNKIKEKIKAQNAAAILSSRFENFPDNATPEEELRLYKRMTNASKKAKRVKKE